MDITINIGVIGSLKEWQSLKVTLDELEIGILSFIEKKYPQQHDFYLDSFFCGIHIEHCELTLPDDIKNLRQFCISVKISAIEIDNSIKEDNLCYKEDEPI